MSIIEMDKIAREIEQLAKQHHSLSAGAEKFEPGITPIPASGKLIDHEEKSLMIQAALDGWLTTGRFNSEFELKLSEFLGVKQCITVNSGSSANLVAFHSLTSPRLGDRAILPGDEVIGVAAGFPTTVNPIIQYGAIPVFVDVDIPTYNIDVTKIENAITEKTKAIMIAHTLGNPFDLAAVREICDKYNLWLIEDCCDALGSTYEGNKVGTFGDIGTLSFYPAHHITMGEGGAVFTNSLKLRKIAESFRDWGRDCYCEPGCDNSCGKRFSWQLGELPLGYDHKYTYSHLGYNLKISDMQAACGVAQLKKLDSFITTRKKNFDYIHKALSPLSDKLILPEATPKSDPSWFGFPITLRKKSGLERREILRHLDKYKIGTRLLFAGNLTKQPYMLGRPFRVASSLENTNVIMEQTFWIGVQPSLSKEMIDYAITEIFRATSKNTLKRSA